MTYCIKYTSRDETLPCAWPCRHPRAALPPLRASGPRGENEESLEKRGTEERHAARDELALKKNICNAATPTDLQNEVAQNAQRSAEVGRTYVHTSRGFFFFSSFFFSST